VAGYHFYYCGPLKQPLSELLPQELCLLLRHGYLGVEIFFVISGFVIAFSVRNSVINFDFCHDFIVRRFLRLAPPYWAAMILFIFINWISNLFLKDRIALVPNLQSIIAHFFYLQDILGIENFFSVSWTLCLEVQFYLVFISLLYVC